MSTEPGNTSPPPPDPPNLSPKGNWGVAPSASPQMTRRAGRFKASPLLWWLVALLIIVVIVVIVFSVG